MPSRERDTRGRRPGGRRRSLGAGFRRLLAHELRELAASRSWWLLLLVVGPLVGHAFVTSTGLYAEASGAGGGAAALAQGLSPLEGIVVPTFGAYDLVATLLFPFVVIRLVASERQTGALTLTLQAPAPLALAVGAKAAALLAGWTAALLGGVAALVVWLGAGGHLAAPETGAVVLGHLLRGVLTIGVGAAAGAVAASASSAAIVALTITLGTWALDYVAAARGGALAAVAGYTPTASLRAFERGELRLATVLVLVAVGAGGLAVATLALDERRTAAARAGRCGAAVVTLGAACALCATVHTSRDVSEDRRNSFPPADEAALAAIHDPLRVTVHLAAEDPRLTELERGVLAKLRRTMPGTTVVYAARGRSGLFEQPGDHYGEVWYAVGARRAMTRSTTEPIVLETIYEVAGRRRPTPLVDAPYPGYPLRVRPAAAPWLFFVAWPLAVAAAWWLARRPGTPQLQEG